MRIDTAALATHLEIALTETPAATLGELQADDHSRRQIAAATLASHLAERLERFDFQLDECPRSQAGQPSLFAK